jgi:ligand-binding sensor domain-containing protein
VTDNNGYLWAAGDGLLSYFDGKRWVAVQPPGFDTTEVAEIYSIRDGRIVIQNSQNQIAIYKNGNWSVYDTFVGFRMNFSRSPVLDHLGNLWFISTCYSFYDYYLYYDYACPSAAVVRFDGKGWYAYTPANSNLPSGDLSQLAVDKENQVWVTTTEGLVLFDGATGQNWRVFDTSNSKLPSNLVQAIYIDPSNVKWLSTGNGLVRYDGTNWTTLNVERSIGSVGQPLIQESGEILLPTSAGTLYWNGKTWATVTEKGSLDHGSTLAILEDVNKVPIAFTTSGINTLRGSQFDYQNYRDLGPSKFLADITQMVKDDDGNLWAASQEAVSVFLQNESWKSFTPLEIGDGQECSPKSLTAYLGGGVFVSCMEGGASLYGQGSWKRLQMHSIGFKSERINHVLRRFAGDLWVATNNGLGRYDGSLWTVYFPPTRSGLFSSMVNEMEEDSKGRLWIRTNDGISYFENGAFKAIPPDTNPKSLGIWDKPASEASATDVWVSQQQSPDTAEPAGNSTLMAEALTLQANKVYRLTFQDQIVSGESGYGAVELSLDGGVSWHAIHKSNQKSEEWQQQTLSLGPYSTASRDVQLRFLFYVDPVEQKGVWRVRDILIDDQNIMLTPMSEGLQASWNSAREMVPDSSGGMWFDFNGTTKYFAENWQSPQAKNEQIAPNALGMVITARNAPVTYFTGNAGKLIKATGLSIDYANELSFSALSSPFRFDGQGKLWIVKDERLSRFDGKDWQVFSILDHPYLASKITGIFTDSDGTVWVGTAAGLLRYRRYTWQGYSSSVFSPQAITDHMIDSKGHLWVATDSGILYREGQTWRYFTMSDGLLDNHVIKLFENASGHEIAVTETGINEWDGQKWVQPSLGISLSPGTTLTSAFLREPGGIRVSTKENGVIDISSDFKLDHFQNFLENAQAFSLAVDQDNIVWLVRDDGLLIRKDGSWILLTLPELNGQRIIWVSTSAQGRTLAGTSKFGYLFDEGSWK